MLASLALVFLFGLAAAWTAKKLCLPRILGMLAAGAVLGPCALDLLSPSILSISGELRQMALVIILIKAGLSLNPADPKRTGRPVLLLSFLPALFEIGAAALLGPLLLPLSFSEAALLGSVLGAVSPAVVVPKMVSLMEEGLGTDQAVPQTILAGAALDDVFVIAVFSSLLSLNRSGAASWADLASVPCAAAAGVGAGLLTGRAMAWFFEERARRGLSIRNSLKVVILLGSAFLLTAAEGWLKGIVPFSGLLAVMTASCALRLKVPPAVAARLSAKFGKLWLAAEAVLFVLVGAAVDLRFTLKAGPAAAALILSALAVRSLGVLCATSGGALNAKERLFCVIAYLPKATVQAAIGSAPLAAGLACGPLVLSAAVLAIVVTAPLGAWGMDATCRRLLRPAAPRQ